MVESRPEADEGYRSGDQARADRNDRLDHIVGDRCPGNGWARRPSLRGARSRLGSVTCADRRAVEVHDDVGLCRCACST
jgi:hypothetical protein